MNPTPYPKLFKQSIQGLIITLIIVSICYYWLDQPITQAIAHHHMPLWLSHASDFIGQYLTTKYFFNFAILALVIGMLCVVFKKCHRLAHWMLLVGGSIILSLIITTVLKTLLGRARPMLFLDHQIYGFHGYHRIKSYNSMPSGHSTAYFATAGALKCLIKKRFFGVSILVIAGLLSLSRLFVLRHYLGDVIAAAYIGIFSAVWTQTVLSTLCRWYQARSSNA